VSVLEIRHSANPALDIIEREPITGGIGFLEYMYCDNDLEEISEAKK